MNIYLDDPDLKRAIRVAAANHGVTLSAYCVEAIRRRLGRDLFAGDEDPGERSREIALAMDRLRREIGPVGIPVRELIDEGRKV